VIVRTALHYIYEHPEVTFHRHALLARIDERLGMLIEMAVLFIRGGDTAGDWARFARTAAERMAPLSHDWLGDLMEFATEDADAMDEAEMRAKHGG